MSLQCDGVMDDKTTIHVLRSVHRGLLHRYHVKAIQQDKSVNVATV